MKCEVNTMAQLGQLSNGKLFSSHLLPRDRDKALQTILTRIYFDIISKPKQRYVCSYLVKVKLKYKIYLASEILTLNGVSSFTVDFNELRDP